MRATAASSEVVQEQVKRIRRLIRHVALKSYRGWIPHLGRVRPNEAEQLHVGVKTMWGWARPLTERWPAY